MPPQPRARQHVIVVDARSARSTRHSGWERYARGLLQGLSAVCPPELTLTPVGSGGGVPLRLWQSAATVPWRSRNADVVHFPTFPPTGWETGPIVYTLHDLTWWREPESASRLGRWLYREQAERALRHAHVITPSAAVAAEATAEFGLPADRVTAVRNPVGLPAPAAPATPPTRPYFLAVGTVEPRKNLPGLAAAWQESGLAASHDLRLVGRTGWGSLPPGLRADVVADDAELAWLYTHAVATVMVSTYEGFGFPVAESLSVGTPVIASDIPALREATLGAATFVDPRDPASIAAALQQVASTPPLVPGPVMDAVRQYTWREAASRIVEVYRQVLR